MTAALISVVITLATLFATVTPAACPLLIRQLVRPCLKPNSEIDWRLLSSRLYLGLILGMGGAGIAASFSGAHTIALAGFAVLMAVMLALTDWRWRWLPLPWTVTLWAIGLLRAMLRDELTDAALASMIVAMALQCLRIGYRYWRQREGMGAGDIILCAGIAAHLGLQASANVVALAAIVALGVQALTPKTKRPRLIPFGSYLCLAFITFLLFWPGG